MTLLQKHILAETIKVFALTILVATLVMTLCIGVKEGLKQGLPFATALQIFPFIIPETLRITVPTSLLFGVCTVFGRMAANGEIASVKSIGIHPFRLFVPVLWLSFLLSLCTYVMYDICAGWARPKLKQTLISVVDDVAYQKLRTERVLHTKNVSIAVKDVIGRRLIFPRMQIVDQDGTTTTVEASEATLDELGNTGQLRISCVNTMFQKDSLDGAFPGTIRYDIPFKDPVHFDNSRYSPAELKSESLDEQIENEQLNIAALRRSQLANGPSSLMQVELKQRLRRLHRLQAESPRRWSNAFSVMAFVLIGIPIATRSESSDNVTVFFMCVAPIAAIYYPLLMLGEELARSGFHPRGSVWLAPTVVAVIGIALMKKLVRH